MSKLEKFEIKKLTSVKNIIGGKFYDSCVDNCVARDYWTSQPIGPGTEDNAEITNDDCTG